MTDTTVVTTNENEVTGSLPDRLDTAIGDASSGIGVMMSELVRRSLRTGVADIERTLTDVTAEKVDLAIEMQMPTISETAHRVAESTSARIVKTVVTESEQRSHEQLQTAVTEFNDAIRSQEASLKANEEQTSEEIAKLNTRAQSSWKKVKNHFDVVDSAFQKAQAKIRELTAAEQETEQKLQKVTAENDQLKSDLQTVSQQLATISKQSEDQAESLRLIMEQNQMLQDRLSELEKPKGLKAVWQKLRPGKSKSSRIDNGDQE